VPIFIDRGAPVISIAYRLIHFYLALFWLSFRMIRNPIGLQEGDAFWQYTRPPLTQAGVSGLYRLFVGRAENGRLAIARCSWLGNSGTHRILNMNEADPSSALGTAVLNIALPSGFIMRPMTLLEQKLPQTSTSRPTDGGPIRR
jgi:hypothetical protein